MKKLKVIISLLLIVSLSFMCPMYNYAYSGAPYKTGTGADKGSSSGAGRARDILSTVTELNISSGVGTILDKGFSNIMASTQSVEDKYDAAIDHKHDVMKGLQEAINSRAGGAVDATLFDMFDEMADVKINKEEVEKEVSASTVTRHYGLTVFHGFVSVNGPLSKSAVQAALTAGHSPIRDYTVHLGGSDSSKPMSGVYQKGSSQAALAQQILAQQDTPDPRDFFNLYGSLVGMSYEQFMSGVSNAGPVNVPYVGVTLAMSTGSGGGHTDILGKYNPYTMSADQFINHFSSVGGQGLVGSLQGDAGVISVNMSPPIGSNYVYPYDGIDTESEFVFGVQSTPKDGVTDWDKGPDDRRGTFTVNVMASDVSSINVASQYEISVNISKGGDGNYSGPYLSSVNITKNEPVTVSGARLAKGEIIPIKIEVTGDGPSDKGHLVLNKGVCQIQVSVSGATATFSSAQELNDEQSKGSGSMGYNYVGWKGSDMEEPEVEKIPWAQHSASEPMINGTLGANELNNEDFNLGVGIPSTENVYVLAGGESAISDMAGYFVLHSNRDFTEVQTASQGENEPGIEPANPSVKREIMLTCSVQNTWGWDNRLCHRQAVGYTASCDINISQGGGTPWSCTSTVNRTWSCPLGGGSGSCTHCGGSHQLGNQNDVAGYGPCPYHGTKWTHGSGNHSYSCSHPSCGGHDGCHRDTEPPFSENHNTSHGDLPTSCAPAVYDHDCSWHLTVYDGDKDDQVNVGVKGGDAVELPSFTLKVDGWQPLGYDVFQIVDYSAGANDIGAEAWKSKVLDVAKGHDSTAYVQGAITFTPVANQYFHLSGSFTVGNNANGTIVTKSVCVSGDDAHWTSKPVKSVLSGSVERQTLSPSNGTEELCNGYSYGTGSRCNEYENCYHLKEHNYTLKYLESIDFYVFRSITDAHLASMRGSKIQSVNQITKSGYESGDGTYGAPMNDSAVGQSVTAPESIGYLWRAVNSTYGSYVNGEGLETGNGEYNGRILFEIWKEPEAGAGGALSYEFNTNFCLGNAEIKAVLLQDNQFGNNPEIKAQYIPTTALESIPDTMPNRGDNEDRYNHDYVTSEEKGKGKGSNYAGHEGDCLNENFSPNAVWDGDTDDTEKSEYRMIIIAEQNAIVNFWQGKNKDDEYHANVISDSMVYGNNVNTTQVVGEYYTVDDGIPLFNYLGGCMGRSEIDDDEEGPIFRNHHSKVGSSGKALADFMIGYNSPTSPSMKESDHFGFFGYGGSGNGGNIALASSLTGMCVEGTIYEIENGNKGSWVPGADVIDSYRRKMGSGVVNGGESNSGITEFQLYLKNAPSPGGDSFAGYWNDHQYPAHVSETIYGRYNGSSGNSLQWQEADCMFTGTNSGTLNQQQYGQSLVMSNLPLVDWTPNGAWPTCDISNVYGWLIDMPGGFDDVTAELYANGVYDAHKALCLDEVGMSLPETIRIYDPISAEESCNIGNQYGAWADGLEDESIYDQRVTSIGKSKNDFAAIGNYVNTYTYVWTWISPFGDFSSVGGSGGSGADITNAQVYRNQGRSGYTSDMYIGTWTKDVAIYYPFVARASNGNCNTSFLIQDLDNVYGSGGSRYMEAAYGPDSLRNFWSNRPNPPFKYGNAVGAVNTVNCVEERDAKINVLAVAINDGIKSSDSSCEYGIQENTGGRNDDKMCNAASKDIPIDIVGQIGNLAIHDTTDFRFSTYFREESDDGSWLINGVIKNVDDESLGIHILAEPKDILFMNPANNDFAHATLGTTSVISGGKYRGMSADFGLLPLTPAYITVPEFKTDALRLGYKVYASIETIGNYQARHKPGVKYPTNYDQAQDPSMDTRDEYMDIVSEYYLYDFDDGKFYAVDLWSGPEGAKQCIYSGADRKVHAQLNSEPLYINMDEELYRRNVGTKEQKVSNVYAVITDTDTSAYTAMYSGLEFIGYTGNIRLDTMDLTYIGSDAVLGKSQFSQQEFPVVDTFYDSSQRWHFTTGLTSTTVPTVPIYRDGVVLTPTQVENAAKSMRDKHPHSVIIEFQNYIAKGSVWTLKYKGSLMNVKRIRFYSNPEDCPYEEKSYLETEYQGKQVYNPETGAEYGSQKIDVDSTPLVTYEAYKSNSEDRTVAGTH